jgi:enamine deaminase RidA (YjgF/YER057c/UK114 family)
MTRKRAYSGAPWEQKAGYCRAIKTGHIIEISGTTAVDEDGNVIGKDDVYMQTKIIFAKFAAALAELGASMTDIVRTRMYVRDISQWEAIAEAHGDFFRDHPPAATMVEVSRLIDDGLLVEIEATAIVAE